MRATSRGRLATCLFAFYSAVRKDRAQPPKSIVEKEASLEPKKSVSVVVSVWRWLKIIQRIEDFLWFKVPLTAY